MSCEPREAVLYPDSVAGADPRVGPYVVLVAPGRARNYSCTVRRRAGPTEAHPSTKHHRMPTRGPRPQAQRAGAAASSAGRRAAKSQSYDFLRFGFTIIEFIQLVPCTVYRTAVYSLPDRTPSRAPFPVRGARARVARAAVFRSRFGGSASNGQAAAPLNTPSDISL